MNKQPLVSILIPAFNAERYIKETLGSALAQTYRHIEIVVVDDGSTDGTANIIKSYNDPRLRYVYQENQGIIRVRNRLLQEARGDFLTYLDSDDIYFPEKVEEEVKFLETNPEYAAVYCDLRYFFDGHPEKLYRHRYTFYSGDIFEHLLEKMFITNTTFMFRRSVIDAIGMYEEAMGTVEDWHYFLKMAQKGFKFGFIPKDLVRFRLRWDNNTRFENQPAIQASGVKIFENLKSQMSPDQQRRYHINNLLFKRKIRLAIAHLSIGKKRDACLTLWDAREHWAWKIIASLLSIFFLLPTVLWRILIEKVWNFKKKNLFVPVN